MGGLHWEPVARIPLRCMSGMSGGLPATRIPNKGQEMLPEMLEAYVFIAERQTNHNVLKIPEALLSFLNVRKIISVLGWSKPWLSDSGAHGDEDEVYQTSFAIFKMLHS